MARTRFASDAGLTARMTSVMFLLGAVFVALVVVLMFVLPPAWAPIIGTHYDVAGCSRCASPRDSTERWPRRFRCGDGKVRGRDRRRPRSRCPGPG